MFFIIMLAVNGLIQWLRCVLVGCVRYGCKHSGRKEQKKNRIVALQQSDKREGMHCRRYYDQYGGFPPQMTNVENRFTSLESMSLMNDNLQ